MPMDVSKHKFASGPIEYRGDLVEVQTGFTQCLKYHVGSCILPYAEARTCNFNWHLFDLTSAFELVNADVVNKSRVHEAPKLQSKLQVDSLEDKGLDLPMTWCEKQAASSSCGGVPADLEVQELTRLTSLVMLQYEKSVLDLVLDPTKYVNNPGNGTNAVNAMDGNLVDLATIDGGNHEFNGSAPYDPLILLTSLISTSPFPITDMALNKATMAYLTIHPAFIANGALSVVESQDMIAAALGLNGICVGQTYSAVGGTKTALFGNFILLFSKSGGTDTECKVPSFGFTAKMKEQGSLDEMYVATFYSWAHGLKGTDFLRTGHMIKPIVAHYELGILIQNPLV